MISSNFSSCWNVMSTAVSSLNPPNEEEKVKDLTFELLTLQKEKTQWKQLVQKIVTFIHARKDLFELCIQRFPQHRQFIVTPPPKVEVKEEDDLYHQITAEQIEILRLKTFIQEIQIFLQSYHDLWTLFCHEVQNARPEPPCQNFSSSPVALISNEHVGNPAANPIIQEKKNANQL